MSFCLLKRPAAARVGNTRSPTDGAHFANCASIFHRPKAVPTNSSQQPFTSVIACGFSTAINNLFIFYDTVTKNKLKKKITCITSHIVPQHSIHCKSDNFFGAIDVSFIFNIYFVTNVFIDN